MFHENIVYLQLDKARSAGAERGVLIYKTTFNYFI